MATLSGKTIVVTRPAPKGQALCDAIRQQQGDAIFFPTIAFAPPHDEKALQDAITRLGQCEWAIFISPQAVTAGLSYINAHVSAWPAHVKIAAVGGGTAHALTQAGLTVAATPDQEWNSEGLLSLPVFQGVDGQHIAIIRGEGGREYIDHELAARGANILPLLVYQRVMPEGEHQTIVPLLQQNKIDAIVCASFDAVNHLKNMLGVEAWPALSMTPLVVMSERIKSLAEPLGFQTIWVAPQASEAAILDVLTTHLRSDKETNMTDHTPPPLSSDVVPVVSGTKKTTTIIIFAVLAMVLLAIGAMVVQLNGGVSLANTNASRLEALQATVQSLQASTKNIEETAAANKQMMEEWRKKQQEGVTGWRIMEARYLVSLANDQVQFAQNDALASAALTQADAILEKINDTGLAEVRQSIATDLASLSNDATSDTTALYTQINTLNQSVDQLPLPEKPLAEQAMASSSLSSAKEDSWQARWQHVKQSLQRIVVVKKMKEGAPPLVMPEEKIFLQQNVHAQLEQAMWAVLHHNDAVYQASLARVTSWVTMYFDTKSDATQTLLKGIASLQGMHLYVKKDPFNKTIALLDHYRTSTQQASSAEMDV